MTPGKRDETAFSILRTEREGETPRLPLIREVAPRS